jgi:hypothetical protein
MTVEDVLALYPVSVTADDRDALRPSWEHHVALADKPIDEDAARAWFKSTGRVLLKSRLLAGVAQVERTYKLAKARLEVLEACPE